jgi:hypothetical protein
MTLGAVPAFGLPKRHVTRRERAVARNIILFLPFPSTHYKTAYNTHTGNVNAICEMDPHSPNLFAKDQSASSLVNSSLRMLPEATREQIKTRKQGDGKEAA